MNVLDKYKDITQLMQTPDSRGPDKIDNKILKLLAPVTAEKLTYLYELCVDKSHFPPLLKQSKVIPVHESGDMENLTIEQTQFFHHSSNPWKITFTLTSKLIS